jgi:hypothetical protein
MARHLPPDHSKGDEHTLGGYMAVHARPAAFEGADGMSYSVDIGTDETGDPSAPVCAYLLFVRWGRGEPAVTGHLETEPLVTGASTDDVRARLGAMPLPEVKRTLDALIRARRDTPSGSTRPWWEAMRDESGTE